MPPIKVRPPGGQPRGAESDGVNVEASLPSEPQHDPFCGRCGGPSGPEGAWCADCIRKCKEYTRRLDLQREAES